MAVNVAQISNPTVLIKPSLKLKSYILNITVKEDMPINIKNLIFKNKYKEDVSKKSAKINYMITDEDRKYIKSLNLNSNVDFFTKPPLVSSFSSGDRLLNLQDLHWLYNYIQIENSKSDIKIYLHELIEGSEIILPKNKEIPRNAELDKRCNRLKAEQDNRDYEKMTKNVDCLRRKLPEDTIGYQLRQMNRHLIAVFQFILSVAAGFMFGFLGIELITGGLEFGFRLLLGIICALVIALAELYFLAKKLNEDLEFEYSIESRYKNVKID